MKNNYGKIRKLAASPFAMIVYFILAAAMLAFFVFSMTGDQSVKVMGDIKARGTLVIGVLDDIKPFGYLDSNDELTGFEVELAQLISEQILGPGSESLTVVTAKTRGAYLDFSYVDILISMVNKSSANADKYSMSDIYYTDPVVFLSKDNNYQLTDKEDTFIGVMLGSPSKDIFSAYLKKNDMEKIQLIDFSSFPDAIEQIKNGKISAFVYEKCALDKLATGGLFISNLNIGNLNYAVTARKTENDLAKQIDKAINALKQNGALDSLYQKYGLQKP